MTIDHPIRRCLARLCSDATMAHVVDPILADVRWERGSAWLACLVLARALALHAVLSIPGVLNRTWSDDGHAIPKIAGFALSGGVLGAMVQVAPWLFERNFANREASLVGIALLLTPGALILSFPASLLLAIPLALRRQEPSRRLARRTIALSLACVAATFALVAWVMPETNQAFRVLASGQQLPRGPNEQGLTVIRERVAVLKLTPGGRVAARPLEFDYHARLMVSCVPLPLGILALAISRSPRGRRRPWPMGLAALSGYMFVFVPLVMGARTVMGWSSLPPVLFAWTPILLLTIISLRSYRRGPAYPALSPEP